jgi:hypothetical protein
MKGWRGETAGGADEGAVVLADAAATAGLAGGAGAGADAAGDGVAAHAARAERASGSRRRRRIAGEATRKAELVPAQTRLPHSEEPHDGPAQDFEEILQASRLRLSPRHAKKRRVT